MRFLTPSPKKALAYIFICLLWCAVLVAVSPFLIVGAVYLDLAAPRKSFLTRGTGLDDLGRELYLSYFRPGYQDQVGAVEFDPELVYVPKAGANPFQGPEFKVTITFEPAGPRRQPPASPSAVGPVVVTGDSFAMGWGVEDGETFSALLAQRHGWPTVNTAVSSYGTARELMRLRRLGLLREAHTVIIAYCYNDPEENRAFVRDPVGFIASRNPAELWKTLGRYHQIAPTLGNVSRLALHTLRERIKADGLRKTLTGLLTSHFSPTGELVEASQPARVMAEDFLTVIDAFPELAEKRLVVTEINDWGRTTRFLPELSSLAVRRKNLTVVPIQFEREDFFRFDNHLNAQGHGKVAASLNRALAQITPAGVPAPGGPSTN
jgi:hypothetical protein